MPFFSKTKIIASLLLAGLVSGSFASEVVTFDRVRVLESPHVVSSFDFIDHQGEPFDLSQLQGQVALVFFGFTNCPDVCPATLARFRELQSVGGLEEGSVAYVLISVDGDRDSPEVLKNYLADFSPEFIGLTGKPNVIQAIAKEFSASFYKGHVSAQDGKYSMMHSPQIFALDPSGQLRAELYNPTVDAMAGFVRFLLEEG